MFFPSLQESPGSPLGSTTSNVSITPDGSPSGKIPGDKEEATGSYPSLVSRYSFASDDNCWSSVSLKVHVKKSIPYPKFNPSESSSKTSIFSRKRKKSKKSGAWLENWFRRRPSMESVKEKGKCLIISWWPHMKEMWS